MEGKNISDFRDSVYMKEFHDLEQLTKLMTQEVASRQL